LRRVRCALVGFEQRLGAFRWSFAGSGRVVRRDQILAHNNFDFSRLNFVH
jgi:hypothetical protein